MGSENGKKMLFSIDQFIILIAWLGTIFAILYFRAYEMIAPSIAAFIILNLALSIWVNRTVRPADNYRKCLVIQTLFLVVWGPLLWILLFTGRADLLPVWIIILVAFYIGIGVISFKGVISGGNCRKESNKGHEHKPPEKRHAGRRSHNVKKAAKKKKK